MQSWTVPGRRWRWWRRVKLWVTLTSTWHSLRTTPGSSLDHTDRTQWRSRGMVSGLTFSSVLTTYTVVDTKCRNVLCALADHKVELTLNILNIRCLYSTVIQYCSIKWCIVRETCSLVFFCIYCIYCMFFVKEKWKNLQPLTSLTLGPAAVVILF